VSDEKPGIAERLGMVAFWLGVGLAGFLVLYAFSTTLFGRAPDWKSLGVLLIAATLCWGAGCVARYVSKADWLDFSYWENK
jgi:hypothetical protein